MNAGRFDRLITIESNTATRDNIGGKVDSWATFAQVWAAYKPVTGIENVNADRIEAKAMVNFIIRYRSDITNAMRINYDGQIYNIKSITELTRRAYLTIETETINN